MPCCGCRPDGVQIATTSHRHLGQHLRRSDVNAGHAVLLADRLRARVASMSHDRDELEPVDCARSPRSDCWLMRPQPTSATRTGSGRSRRAHRRGLARPARCRRRTARTSIRTPRTSPAPLSGSRSPHWHIQPIRRAGTPTISAYAGTSFVTTAPAPTNAYSPSVDAADDRRVRADRRAAPHERPPVLVLARDVAARIDDVREHHRRPAEHVVLELDALVDRDVVLDLHVVADPRAVHHDDVLAERAALADDRAAEHVAEMPDLRAGADRRAVVDVRGLVNERVRRGCSHLDCRGVEDVLLPLLQRPHRRRGASAARGSRRTRRSPPRASSCTRRGGDRRLAQRVVVLLRVLAERRVDQQLDVAVHDQVDAVRPALVHLEHALDGNAARRAGTAPCRRVASSLKPISWNRRAIGVTRRLVGVVHRDEDRALERQPVVRRELRLARTRCRTSPRCPSPRPSSASPGRGSDRTRGTC